MEGNGIDCEGFLNLDIWITVKHIRGQHLYSLISQLNNEFGKTYVVKGTI